MSSVSLNPPSDFEPILQRLEGPMKALALGELLRPVLDPESVLELSKTLLKAIAPFQTDLRATFSDPRSADIEAAIQALPERLWGYHAIDGRVDLPHVPVEKTTFRALAKKVHADDQSFSKWADSLFQTIPQEQSLLAKIRAGRGHQDDGKDVIAWVELFRRYPNLCKPIDALAPATLEQAHKDATTFLGMLPEDETSHPSEASPLRSAWYRTYSLWFQAAKEIRDALLYLFRDDPSTQDALPKLSPKRKPSSKKQ